MNHIEWMEREQEKGESTVDTLCGILGGLVLGAAMMALICLGLQLDQIFKPMDREVSQCSKP